MTLVALQQRGREWARIFTIALGASLPFSTALDNIFLGLTLLCWLAGGDYRAHWERLRYHPVAWVVVGFVTLFALGLTYGERVDGDGVHYFGKYADFLFVVVFLSLFSDAMWRQRALVAFAASLALLLILSYLIRLGMIPPNHWIVGTPANPVVFKQWITHNILMALGAFSFTLFGLQAQRPMSRAVWYGLAVFAVVNVLFMIPGRTGYVVLALLALYLGYVWRHFAGLGIAAACSVVVITIVFTLPGTLHNRTELAMQEFHQSRPQVASQTSIGLRLEFYRNSLAIIRDHPLIGVGTGGFTYAYEKEVAGTGMDPTRNPHDEYLHVTVQLGIVGLIALLALFWIPWRTAPLLPAWHERHLARGLVLTIAAGCIFNSLLIDHTERLLFAWGLGILFAGLQSRTPSPSFVHR